MSKEFVSSIELREYNFNPEQIHRLADNNFVKNTWPVTYIIYSNKIKEAYIGETTNAASRMKSHLMNPKRQNLSTLQIITSDKFNKSSVLDLESNLIKYLAADGQYKLQNGNAGLVNHNYYQRDKYQGLFKHLWALLKEKGIAKSDLQKIDNSDLFKYSPYKSLSDDQFKVSVELLGFIINDNKKLALVEGKAGTGKTVLATYLIKLLKQDDPFIEFTDEDGIIDDTLLHRIELQMPEMEIGFVVPMTSLRKTLKKVFRHVKGLNANMVIGPSDVLKKQYDLLIVDEAHRLHRRVGITNYKSFDDASKKLGFNPKTTNELDWIRRQSKKQILFYDQHQSIRPSDIPQTIFDELKENKSSIEVALTSQLRVEGGLDYIGFVNALLDGELDASDPPFRSDSYELVLFDSFKDLLKTLKEKEELHGLSRLIAGYAWEWISKKDKTKFDIQIEGINLQWNNTNEDWINSNTAFSEVGCIHTTQGYDLNYAGIIFGSEISYDKNLKKIIIKPENYHDRNGKVSIKDPEQLKEYIINIYKTLMFRGIKGTYLYVIDADLKEYLQNVIATN